MRATRLGWSANEAQSYTTFDDYPGAHTLTEPDPGAPSDSGEAAHTCNALRQRGERGFCQFPAGFGTQHVGEGRCYLHGGKAAAKAGKAAIKALPQLAEFTRRLSLADAEAIMAMGTMAMVLARGQLMERLLAPGIGPQEANHITMAVTRLDNLLAKHPEIDDPDKAQSITTEMDQELKRLLELEQA